MLSKFVKSPVKTIIVLKNKKVFFQTKISNNLLKVQMPKILSFLENNFFIEAKLNIAATQCQWLIV